jgi:hypothetical protein
MIMTRSAASSRVARASTSAAAGTPHGGSSREGTGFLVAHVHPVDPAASRSTAAADRVDHRIEAVADDAIDPLYAGLLEYLDS